jgi:hypothetical protein
MAVFERSPVLLKASSLGIKIEKFPNGMGDDSVTPLHLSRCLLKTTGPAKIRQAST